MMITFIQRYSPLSSRLMMIAFIQCYSLLWSRLMIAFIQRYSPLSSRLMMISHDDHFYTALFSALEQTHDDLSWWSLLYSANLHSQADSWWLLLYSAILFRSGADSWSLLYSTILHSGADSLCSCHMWVLKWVTVAFYSTVWISTQVVPFSTVWFYHGWCHMKPLPSRRVLCTPCYHAPCHITSCKATYVWCKCV